MNYMLRAAMAALSIGSIPPAIAAVGGANPSNAFTDIPAVIAQAPTQAERRQSAQTSAQSGHGGWLFPPIGNYLNQRAG